MKNWPTGLATVTVRWDDGMEFYAPRVDIRPGDFMLSEPERAWSVVATSTALPPPLRSMGLRMSGTLYPDDEDTFYTMKVATSSVLPIVVIFRGAMYRFSSLEEKCVAHGTPLCVHCARNPGSCVKPDGGCSMWSETGMHWDTCPNRI